MTGINHASGYKTGPCHERRWTETELEMFEVVSDPVPVSEGGFKPGVRFFKIEWEFMKSHKTFDIGMIVRSTKTGALEVMEGQLQLC
jgi:hypothetical protein